MSADESEKLRLTALRLYLFGVLLPGIVMFGRWFEIALKNAPLGGPGNRMPVLFSTDPMLRVTAVLLLASSVALAMIWTWGRARELRLRAMPFYLVSALVFLAINLYRLLRADPS